MAKCEKILICGFSGAGKTSFLRELEFTAPEVDWSFSDLDQMVLKVHGGNSLAEVIETQGWDQFRLWERQELEKWLKIEGQAVLSLGGGTLNQLLLDLYRPIKKIKICHLASPFNDCWNRLHLKSSELRPLLLLGREQLQKIYQDREKIFQQVSWKIENPQGSDLSVLAQRFWSEVGS